MTDAVGVLGVLGFILGCINTAWAIAWQVWKHRLEKIEREEQKKEKVIATVSMTPKPCVELYNQGSVGVYIRGVELVIDENGKQRTFPLQIPIIMHTLPAGPGQLGAEVWQATGRQTYKDPLLPGCHYYFTLGGLSPELWTAVQKLEDMQKLYISVYSNAGEIARIGGEKILPWIHSQATRKEQ